MPVNPLGPSFVNKWNSRVQQAQSAGIPVQTLAPLFQQDIKSLQGGGQGLTDQEFALGALSNFTQQPALHPVSTKPNWNPMGLIGRAVKDVGEIGKGIITLPKTVAHDVAHIGEMPGQIAKGASDIGHGHIGEGLQEIATAPGLQEALIAGSFLIPGGEAVTAGLRGAVMKAGAGVLAGGVAGQALTPEGRKQISQHPGIALVNLLPAAGEAGLTEAAKAALKETAVAQSAGKVMDQLGISPAYREQWRKFSDARKLAHNKVSELWQSSNELFGKIEDPKLMAEVTRAMKSGDPNVLKRMEAKVPGFAEAKTRYDALEESLSKDPEHFVHLPTAGGVTEVYPVRSLPARAYAAVGAAKDKLAVNTETLATRARNLADARARLDEIKVPDLAKITEEIKPEAEAEMASVGFKSRLAGAADAIRNEDYRRAGSLFRRAGRFDLAEEMSAVRPQMAEYVKARQSLNDAEERFNKAKVTQDQLAKRTSRKERQFQKFMEQVPPARWHPNVTDEFHNLAEKWAQDYYSNDPKRLAGAVGEITNRYYGGAFEDGAPIFPTKELRRVERDAVAQIEKWKAQGWNPSYVHTVTESQVRQLRYPQIGKRAEPAISSFKEKHLANSEEVSNVALSLTHQQAEVFVNQQWHDAWHGWDAPDGHQPGILENFGKTQSQLVDDLRKRDPERPVADILAQVRQEWESPSRYSPTSVRNVFAKDNVLIPRSLATNIDKLAPSLEPATNIKAGFDKATRGFRFAVTGLSPQHTVHIIASGGVMFGMAMTDLPAVLSSIGDARKMIKEGKVPTRFTQEASMLPQEEALTFGTANRTAARLYSESVSKALHPLQRLNEAVQHFDEHVTQWYKTLDYVSQTKRGLDPERALYEVSKHFADHAGRSPIERAIFKSYVPFGSWTQHLIRYAFKFPADHPLRAAVFANLSQAEFQDEKSGLPRDLSQLFFSGKQAFDIRSFNPFRDLGRNLSLAGLISGLNPAAQAVFQSKGYNPITDSAELYPELTIDPNTGKVITKGSNFFQALGEAVIPQTQGVEALLGWSDSMRRLKAQDPKAYASTLARYLHFPWLPKDVSVPELRTKGQINELRISQQEVSKAMKSGDFSKVKGFNVVPFQGKMIPPATLEAIYKMARKVQPNFPANVVLR